MLSNNFGAIKLSIQIDTKSTEIKKISLCYRKVERAIEKCP